MLQKFFESASNFKKAKDQPRGKLVFVFRPVSGLEVRPKFSEFIERLVAR